MSDRRDYNRPPAWATSRWTVVVCIAAVVLAVVWKLA